MSYGTRAFREVFLPATSGGTILMASSGLTSTTSITTPGQLGVFTVRNSIIGSSVGVGQSTTSDIIIVEGSYHTKDAIAPGIGGMKMSDKTHRIPISGIKRFWKKSAVSAAPMVISVGWNQTTSGSTALVGPTFQCGTYYRLLLEAKGEAALRVFGHEVYRDAEAWTGCCGGNCQSGCTGQLVDPVTVMLQWSDYIKQDPILSTMFYPAVFINGSTTGTTGSGTYTYNTGNVAQVFSAYDVSISAPGVAGGATYGSVAAGSGAATVGAYVPSTNATTIPTITVGLQLQTAYVDTVFNTCTFTPSDYYYVDALLIYASLRMDDGLQSDPCQVTTTINTSVPNMVVTTQTVQQASGLGQFVARDWVLYRRYLMENFPDGYEIDMFRMRQIEDDVVLANVNLSGAYDEIHIRYLNTDDFNPKPADNARVWEAVFYVPTGTSTTNFTNIIANSLSSAGNTVILESF